MKLHIQNYTPQNIIALQKRRAVWVWMIATAIAFLWLAAIISAPILEIYGARSISQPIYLFFSFICHQISARSFHIDGFQLAVCARCFGFYAGFLGGFILYPFFRNVENIDSFPRIWLFLAMVPMGIDVGLTFFGIWENTHLSRLVTGIILGVACAFFIVPALVEIGWLLATKSRNRRKLSEI